MLRRGVSRLNSKWHGLQEFAIQEADAAAFRTARNAAAQASEIVDAAGQKQTPIDWNKYQSEIRHQDLVTTLKNYHDEQIKLLDNLISSDHQAAVKETHLGTWDATFEETMKTAQKSVEKSEEIVANGAKALYISYNNPPVDSVSTSEWLDVDQYWQAFVEKHQFYHNHLDMITEDPESKEYDQKVKSEMMKNFKLHDDVHPRKNLLYQMPTHEYYSMFRGVLVEHMVYYLVKTGGDARVFPDLMPHKWFNQIYDVKFKLLELIQERKREAQNKTLAREIDAEFHPHDMGHDGESYYAAMIQRENMMVENQVARLMANYIFLSDAVPVQSSAGLQAVASGGKIFSLGDDVNALFVKTSEESSPVAAASNFNSHVGSKLHPVYQEALTQFCGLLEARKSAMGGAWFNMSGEHPADCFLRRLKDDDSTREVYVAYVEELKARWASATEVSASDAAKRIVEIEKNVAEETEAYAAFVWENGNPEVITKIEGILSDNSGKISG